MSYYANGRSSYATYSEFDDDEYESRAERYRRNRRNTRRSVVKVKTNTAHGSGSGSGIVWNKLGHVLTSHHVVDGATQIGTRIPNGKPYKAKVVAYNPVSDCSVLHTRAPAQELHPLPRAYKYKYRDGRHVAAAGYAHGEQR